METSSCDMLTMQPAAVVTHLRRGIVLDIVVGICTLQLLSIVSQLSTTLSREDQFDQLMGVQKYLFFYSLLRILEKYWRQKIILCVLRICLQHESGVSPILMVTKSKSHRVDIFIPDRESQYLPPSAR